MVKNILLRVGLVSISNWACATPSFVEPPALSITLGSNNSFEQKGKKLLEDLVTEYRLEKYFWTTRIHIQTRVVPHSHPILTLNTWFINEPKRFMGVFIHEQIHWLLYEHRKDETARFIDMIRKEFPEVPDQEEGGGTDDRSTYLHLAVCYFEFEELSKLIGYEDATTLFATEEVYWWIRRQVLEKGPTIRQTLATAGLTWEYAH